MYAVTALLEVSGDEAFSLDGSGTVPPGNGARGDQNGEGAATRQSPVEVSGPRITPEAPVTSTRSIQQYYILTMSTRRRVLLGRAASTRLTIA